MFELDELGTGGSLDSGFIIGKEIYKDDITNVGKSKLLTFTNASLSLDDSVIYLMNGLYALKEGHNVIFVVIFDSVFSVSLRKYAEPNEADILHVYEMLKMAITKHGCNSAIEEAFAMLLAQIKSGRLKYVK